MLVQIFPDLDLLLKMAATASASATPQSNPNVIPNDNQSNIAFRNLKNAKLFALDIGGSLTKIAYYSTGISQRTLYRPGSKIRYNLQVTEKLTFKGNAQKIDI